MKLKPHFLALLTFVSEENGGRKTPVSSGYRAGIQFPFHETPVLSAQDFIEEELVFPGDTVNAEITLIGDESFDGKLYEGLDFNFFEGVVLMGSGVIKKVNPK